METAAKTMHLGRKISRLRELRGIRQEALAAELGITQQAISKLEASEIVSDETLEKVGNVLGLSAEAIRNFNEESIFQIISNTYHDNSSSVQYNFNPIDKIVELYERLVQAEKDRADALEKVLKR